MGKICLLLLSCLGSLAVFSQLSGNGPSISHSSSMNGPPIMPRELSPFSNIVNINGQDGYYFKKDLYLHNAYTIIDGERVLGIPFLFIDWYGGSLTTPDGRVYTDYKFKYNVENQTVSFLNGKDSLEVNEEIKEFTLSARIGDSVINSRFINSNQYQKGKTTYYEVLIDNERGQVLKTNKKVVATTGDGIIASKTSKYLKLESEFFYYDKSTKKITRIKPSGNFASILKLSEEEVKEINMDSFDASKEEEILRFFKLYFEKKKKAF